MRHTLDRIYLTRVYVQCSGTSLYNNDIWYSAMWKQTNTTFRPQCNQLVCTYHRLSFFEAHMKHMTDYDCTITSYTKLWKNMTIMRKVDMFMTYRHRRKVVKDSGWKKIHPFSKLNRLFWGLMGVEQGWSPTTDDISSIISWNLSVSHSVSNPLMRDYAYLRNSTGSSLVQIMACRLFGTKPLPKQWWLTVNWKKKHREQTWLKY